MREWTGERRVVDECASGIVVGLASIEATDFGVTLANSVHFTKNDMSSCLRNRGDLDEKAKRRIRRLRSGGSSLLVVMILRSPPACNRACAS